MAIEVVSVEAWRAFPWLLHGFSTRQGGTSTAYGGRSLNLGWTKEDSSAVVQDNRWLLMQAVNTGSPGQLATLRQTHGVGILSVTSAEQRWQSDEGKALHEGDGLVTAAPGVLLGIQTADCVPVLLVDVKQRAVVALHAGWRGTAAGMAAAGVDRMRQEFGSQPEDLRAAVGPSIGSCCYSVGDEVKASFAATFSYAHKLFAGDRLDLWAANRQQLVKAGLLSQHIAVIGECTGCTVLPSGERKYFSHRVERGHTGRMMNLIGIANE